MINQIWKNSRCVTSCLLIGLIGGLLLFVIEQCQGLVWTPLFLYDVGIIQGLQVFGSFALGLLTIGAISFWIVKADTGKNINAVYRGILTGLSAGLTFLLINFGFFIFNFEFFYPFPKFMNTVPAFAFVLFGIMFFSLVLGGTGAYILNYWDQQQRASSLPIVKLPMWFSRRISQIFICFIFIFLFTIGPAMIAYSAIWVGIIRKTPDCCGVYFDTPSIGRVSNDSLELIQPHKKISEASDNRPDYYGWFPASPTHPASRFEIFVNGNDVSNASMIQNHGLHYTIDPPEGLNDPYHSRTILRSPDIVRNRTNPILLTVDEIFYSGNRSHVFENVEL
jgi:hypothetical protein